MSNLVDFRKLLTQKQRLRLILLSIIKNGIQVTAVLIFCAMLYSSMITTCVMMHGVSACQE